MSGTERGVEWDWRSDESAANKADVIKRLFEGASPSGLYYDLRGLDETFTDQDILDAAIRVFDYKEFQQTRFVIRPHESIEGGRALIVTHPAKKWVPKLVIGEQDCHLFYVDRVSMSSNTSFSFAVQWGWARFLPGTRVRVQDAWHLSVIGKRGGLEDRSSVFFWNETAVLTVMSTYFISSRNRALSIVALLLDRPEIAALVSSLISSEDDAIDLDDADLEVAEVCVHDGDGDHHVRICAHMLEEVLP